MAGPQAKSKLSKNTLQMKFMRRSVVQAEVAQNEAEKQRIIDDEHWAYDIPELKQKQSSYQCEPSFVAFEDLQFGRRSYQGFNKEIEKIMRSKNIEQGLAEARRNESELEVTDQEMVERYSSVVGTIQKKFNKGKAKKRKHKNNVNNTDAAVEVHEPKTDNGDESGKKEKKSKHKKQFMKPSDDS